MSLYTFGLTGGIEKVCQTLAKALSNLTEVNSGLKFKHFSMYDTSAQINPLYLEPKYFKGFGGNKLFFMLASIWKGFQSDTIILSHINLLIIVPFIKFLSPKTKIILYAHGIEIWDSLPLWKREILQNDLEIWAVSNFTANKIALTHQISKTHIKILNNAIDPYFHWPQYFEKPAQLLKRFKLDANQPILYTLTRLNGAEGYKGYDRVLAALPPLIKKFPQLIYIIAGKADEMEFERLSQYIKSYGIDQNVKIIGFINESEKVDYYQLADVFIMPSSMEGFGIVFIEAAACGVQTIGGNKDGSTDALLNGELGKLISPDNIVEIELAIEHCLNQKVEPQQIQAKCRKHFSFENYQSQIKHLLNIA